MGVRSVSAVLTLQGILIEYPDLIKDNLYPYLPGALKEWVPAEEFENMLVHRVWDMEVLYPEPTGFGKLVKSWAVTYKRAWFAIYNDWYNMLSTRPGEVYEETTSRSGQSTGRENERNNSQTGGSDSTTNQVSAFNTNAFVNHDMSTTDYGGNAEYNRDATDNRQYNNKETRGYTRSKELDRFKLLKDRIDFDINFEMCSAVIEQFAEQFCLLVY